MQEPDRLALTSVDVTHLGDADPDAFATVLILNLDCHSSTRPRSRVVAGTRGSPDTQLICGFTGSDEGMITATAGPCPCRSQGARAKEARGHEHAAS
jgi:hypothetical protein